MVTFSSFLGGKISPSRQTSVVTFSSFWATRGLRVTGATTARIRLEPVHDHLECAIVHHGSNVYPTKPRAYDAERDEAFHPSTHGAKKGIKKIGLSYVAHFTPIFWHHSGPHAFNRNRCMTTWSALFFTMAAVYIQRNQEHTVRRGRSLQSEYPWSQEGIEISGLSYVARDNGNSQFCPYFSEPSRS